MYDPATALFGKLKLYSTAHPENAAVKGLTDLASFVWMPSLIAMS